MDRNVQRPGCLFRYELILLKFVSGIIIPTLHDNHVTSVRFPRVSDSVLDDYSSETYEPGIA